MCQMCTRKSLRPILGGPSLARSPGPRGLLLRARPRLRYLPIFMLLCSFLPTGIPNMGRHHTPAPVASTHFHPRVPPCFLSGYLCRRQGTPSGQLPCIFVILFTAALPVLQYNYWLSEAIAVDIVASAGCDDGQQWRRIAVATGTLRGLRGLTLSILDSEEELNLSRLRQLGLTE